MHSATGLRRSRPVIHVLICLLLILAGAVGASLIQTGGGHIAVQGLKIPGKDGAELVPTSSDPTRQQQRTKPLSSS